MAGTDKAISDILQRYGEPFAGSVWRVQGTAVIYHKALERIATQAGIRFDIPVVIRAERDEAVLMVVGRMAGKAGEPERVEWSLGEALVNVNYRVSGKQAAYVFAMAEKRGKDRVILKLIELSGLVYSEDEADDFKRRNADPVGGPDRRKDAEPDPASPQGIEARIRRDVDACQTHEDVAALLTQPDVQEDIACFAEGVRERIRDHGIERMKALGWQPKPRDRRAS